MRRVQALLRSTRRRFREGRMVIEGLRLVREAVLSSVAIDEVFYVRSLVQESRGANLLADLRKRGITVWEVSPQVLALLSDTETPQGVVAVAAIPHSAARPGLILVLDNLRDPGNLGTVLRSAWAAGVGRVLLPPGTVDVTNPKVVRAGMGAHFHVPFEKVGWDNVRAAVAGRPVWLAAAGAGVCYDQVDWTRAPVLIIGGEAEGASAEAQSLAQGHIVSIPMAPAVESLNAAMAATILLFEAARQQRAFPEGGA
ncbi:MAG: RNA methyltransferase [Anaerolineae bacterium]|nr:RNA methyltransferase [Anaerolineae bacterium]